MSNLKPEPSSEEFASPNKKGEVGDRIHLRIQLPDAGEVIIVCRLTSTIAKVIEGVALERRLDKTRIRLICDGQRLASERTVGESGLRHDDVLTLVLEQTGGGRVSQ